MPHLSHFCISFFSHYSHNIDILNFLMPFEFDDQQNEAWNCNDVNSIIKHSSFKHSFKSCNSADISRKSNNATKGTHNANYSISRKSNNATKGTHNANYSISRKSNKSNNATKGTHNAKY